MDEVTAFAAVLAAGNWNADRTGQILFGLFVMFAAWSAISLVSTYFSAVVGWTMGIFIHRNYEHFDAIRAAN
jgi:hypothetical protein